MSAVDKELSTPSDMAALFEVDERKVMDWRREYDWPCIRVGRTFRFTREQVRTILERHAVKPQSSTAPPAIIPGQSKRSAARSGSVRRSA